MEGRNNRILEIDSLAIYFGGLKAIDGVSLYIEKNDFLGLIGPNGAGKSTLFNAITGNIVPTMGTIAFNNTVINKKRPDQICHLGISRTFQNIRLFPKMTAIENVSIGMNSIPKYSLLQAAIRSGKVEQINRETIDQDSRIQGQLSRKLALWTSEKIRDCPGDCNQARASFAG